MPEPTRQVYLCESATVSDGIGLWLAGQAGR